MEDITTRAAELAATMHAWLTDPRTAPGFADPDTVPSSLVEWCRSARDVLAQFGAETVTYSCGTPVLHRTGRCDCVSLSNLHRHLPAPRYSPGEMSAAAAADPAGQ